MDADLDYIVGSPSNMSCELLARDLVGRVDLIVTSPPYYNAREYIQWDSYGQYLRGVEAWGKLLSRTLKPARCLLWNVAPHIIYKGKKYPLGMDSQAALSKTPTLTWYDTIIWKKPFGGRRLSFAETKWVSMHRKGRFPPPLAPLYEFVHVFGSQGKENRDGVDFDYWSCYNHYEAPTGHLKGHHAVFSEEMVTPLIEHFSRPGDLVFDPFGGSFTTAVVAERLGRRWVSCDVNEEFVKYGQERLKAERAKVKDG